MANIGKTKGEDELEVPRIVNVAEFRATARKPTLLHFTAGQWKHALRDVKEIKDLPPELATLEAVLMPGGSGAMLVGPYKCPPGCIRLAMRYIPPRKTDPAGLMPRPDSIYIPDCDCPPEEPPIEPTVPPITAGCRLIIRLMTSGTPQVRNPVLACEMTNCGRCEVVALRQPNSTYLITCVCRG